MAEGNCPKDQVVVEQLGDSEDTILTTSGPSMTGEALNELPDLSGYVAESSCPKERVVAVGLGDGVPTIPDIPDLTTSINKLPPPLGVKGRGHLRCGAVGSSDAGGWRNHPPQCP